MRKLASITAALVASLGIAAGAQAQTVLNYFEQTTAFEFVNAGPLERSIGDVIFYETILVDTNSGNVEATKEGTCTTNSQLQNGDFVGSCYETITFNNGDTLQIQDDFFNQTAFERFEPEQMTIMNGTGSYANASGVQNLVQVRFPDQAAVTLIIN